MKNFMLIAAISAITVNVAADSFVEEHPTLVGDSFGFVEGPAWDKKHQRFLFSDIPNNKTYSYDLSGTLSVIDENSGYANGLDIDKEGNIWAARHDRKLSFTQPNGDKVIAATTYNGKPLNSPNDLSIKSDGSVWFSDPPFGIQGYGPQKAEEVQPVRGIYRYQNGDITLMSGELELPNGIAFSPDESFLYVANTSDGWVYRFNVEKDTIHNKHKFAKVIPSTSSKPLNSEPMADGVEVDQYGNVLVAGPGGIGVFNSDGEQIEYIAIDAGHISNLEIGGQNHNLLMVTAANKVVIFKIK